MIETKKSGGLFSSFMSPVAETQPVPAAVVDSPPATPKPTACSPSSPKSLNQEENEDSPESKMKKLISGGKPKKFEPKKRTPVSPQPAKKGKTGTKWEDETSGPLDYGEKPSPNGNGQASLAEQNDLEKYASLSDVGKGKDLKAIEIVDSPIEDYEDEEEEQVEIKSTKKTAKQNGAHTKPTNGTKPSQTGTSRGGGGGLFSSLKSLVGSKTLTKEIIEPVMEKLQDHLIGNLILNLKTNLFSPRRII